MSVVPPEERIFIASVVVILVLCFFVTQHYVSPETKWHVRLDVMLALATSASIVALVPFDIYTTLLSVDDAIIPILWSVAYWTTQALTWLLLPIHQIYADAGDFTVIARLSTAVRENLIFYAVVGGLSVLGIVVLLVFHHVSMQSLAHTLIALSNTFGIATGIFLMGYGLVDIPRELWNMADCQLMLQRDQQRVAELSQALTEAHAEVSHAVMVVQTTAQTMPRRHPLRWAMDVIDQEAAQLVPVRLAGELRFEELGDDYDYDFDDVQGLAALRRRLKRATTVYMRTKYQYMLAVKDAFMNEDILDSSKRAAQGGSWRFRGKGAGAGEGNFAEVKERLLFIAKCTLRTPALKLSAVVFGVFSCGLILAESTIWVNSVFERTDLSVFSHVIKAVQKSNPVAIQVVVMVPLMYMCVCLFYSIFKLGKFKLYSLTPHSSDAFSMLLCGALVCRYSAPMCYNFLSMVPVVEHQEGGRTTVFGEMMGGINAQGLPHIFNIFFPAVLPVFCFLITVNIFNRAAGACCGCCSKFKFDENENMTDVEMTDKGVDILRQERGNLQAGLPIGEGTVNTPGITQGLLDADPPSGSTHPLQLSSFPVRETNRARQAERSSSANRLPPSRDFDLEANPENLETGTRWDRAKSRLANALNNTGATSGPRPPAVNAAEPLRTTTTTRWTSVVPVSGNQSGGANSGNSSIQNSSVWKEAQPSGKFLDNVFAGLGGSR